MYYTVYKTTNLVNSKVYIGCHKTKNLDDGYIGSGKLLKLAIKKYGLENFKSEYLGIFDNSMEMFKMEALLVNEKFILEDTNYNLKVGGHGGFEHLNDPEYTNPSHSLEHMKYMSKCGLKNRAAKLTDLSKNDKEWNENRKRRISASLNKYYTSGGKGGFLGKTHKLSSKIAIGKANSVHQKGVKNSQYGTCWIYSIDQNSSKKIKKDQLEKWLQKGWIQGRKQKSRE